MKSLIHEFLGNKYVFSHKDSGGRGYIKFIEFFFYTDDFINYLTIGPHNYEEGNIFAFGENYVYMLDTYITPKSFNFSKFNNPSIIRVPVHYFSPINTKEIQNQVYGGYDAVGIHIISNLMQRYKKTGQYPVNIMTMQKIEKQI